jgi:hypothetical protein
MRLVPLIAVVLLASLSGCTFVKMAPGADQVSVLALGAAPAACEKRGEIEVSVKDRLGPYERDNLRVMDELETLARNEAPSLSADTIQPRSAPDDGTQRFLAYRCAGAQARRDEPRDRAETVPLGD